MSVGRGAEVPQPVGSSSSREGAEEAGRGGRGARRGRDHSPLLAIARHFTRSQCSGPNRSMELG